MFVSGEGGVRFDNDTHNDESVDISLSTILSVFETKNLHVETVFAVVFADIVLVVERPEGGNVIESLHPTIDRLRVSVSLTNNRCHQ